MQSLHSTEMSMFSFVACHRKVTCRTVVVAGVEYSNRLQHVDVRYFNKIFPFIDLLPTPGGQRVYKTSSVCYVLQNSFGWQIFPAQVSVASHSLERTKLFSFWIKWSRVDKIFIVLKIISGDPFFCIQQKLGNLVVVFVGFIKFFNILVVSKDKNSAFPIFCCCNDNIDCFGPRQYGLCRGSIYGASTWSAIFWNCINST